MSQIYLTDIVIRCPSERYSDLPNKARLFIVCGNKVRRIKNFTKEHTGQSWMLEESIQIPDSGVLSTRLTVMMEHPLHNFQQFGFLDLVGADVITQCVEQKNEIIQVHIQTSNGLPLEFVFHCVVIPPDIYQEHSSDVFADATEEEAVRYRLSLAQSSGQVTEFDAIRIFIGVKYEYALHLYDENTEKPLRLCVLVTYSARSTSSRKEM